MILPFWRDQIHQAVKKLDCNWKFCETFWSQHKLMVLECHQQFKNLKHVQKKEDDHKSVLKDQQYLTFDWVVQSFNFKKVNYSVFCQKFNELIGIQAHSFIGKIGNN